MAVWSRDFNLLYSLCPRTASTATANVIVKSLSGVWIPQADILHENGQIVVQKKHTTFNEVLDWKLLPAQVFDSAVRAVTVRNPFDSVYSVWFKKKYTYPKLLGDRDAWMHRLPGFVDDMEFIASHSFNEWFLSTYEEAAAEGRNVGVNRKWVHRATRFLRFESLHHDFQELLVSVGVRDVPELLPVNITEGRPADYREAYSAEARQVGEAVFRWELDRFNYDF